MTNLSSAAPNAATLSDGLARVAGSVPHAVLTSVSNRVPRFYYR